MLRRGKWIFTFLVIVLVAAWFDRFLPKHDVVRITGTDTKRIDTSGWFDSEAQNMTVDSSRDVRFIYATYPDGNVRVYRNEDTDWSFPFYFKFSSGDVQGKAQALISPDSDPKWALVTYYGWRIPLVTMFPNAVDVEEATGPEQYVFPWFNLVFLGTIGALAFWIYVRILRFKVESVDPMIDRVEDRLDDAAHEARGWWSRLTGRARR